MIELTNSSAQVVQPGGTLTLNTLVFKSGCSECYQKQLNTVRMKVQGGVYELKFSGNVSSATAGTPVQLAIAVGGVPLPETVMQSTPSTANVFNNISTGTYFRMGCADTSRVSVINTGTSPVTVSGNLNLRIERKG